MVIFFLSVCGPDHAFEDLLVTGIAITVFIEGVYGEPRHAVVWQSPICLVGVTGLRSVGYTPIKMGSPCLLR